MNSKLDHEVADLKQRLDEALVARDEAEAQKAAITEVLEVINSSAGNIAPVFKAILARATRLCDAQSGIFWAHEGEHFRAAAFDGVHDSFADFLRQGSGEWPSQSLHAIQHGEAFVHDLDLAERNTGSTNPLARAVVDLEHARTGLLVPLLSDRKLLGAIRILRRDVRSFTPKQIDLLQSFAAQAVIAMENARLLGELRQRTDDLQESLEYQTATSDVLKVISRSTFDLQSVLQTLAETAARLCEAEMAGLITREGEAYRLAASFALSPEYIDFFGSRLWNADRGTVFGRAILGRETVHIEDIADDPEYALPETITVGNFRTTLGVPLLREGEPIGVIVLARQRVKAFAAGEIGLVRTFADQAVIAMENARLINETREALEQQTATAEVLQVINSSPGDLAPVFDAMLEKAMRLCGAAFGIMSVDGERLRPVAARGIPAGYAGFIRENPPRLGQPGIVARIRDGEPFVHIIDLKNDDLYRDGDPQRRAMVDLGGARTSLVVPLKRDGELLGGIQIYRQEVRAFSEKQIALLQNFAAQAVIAMENARLITETREALEQQTATAEVLGVINSSPGDLGPVFDAILEKAHNLCGAEQGVLVTYDGENFRGVATHGLPEALAEVWRKPSRASPGSEQERLLRGERLIHIPDIAAGDVERPDHLSVVRS